MSGNFKSEQMEYRGALDQITAQGAAATTLESVLQSINANQKNPLALSAENPVSRTVNISGVSITNPAHGRKSTIPPIDGVIPTFNGGTLTLPASSGGSITASGFSLASAYTLTVTSGNFIKILVALNQSGQIVLLFGVEGASESAATVPAVQSSVYTVGYLVAQNIAGVIQNISESNIYKFFSGSSGGGGSAGTIPLGGIIAVTTGLTGAFSVPVSGVVSDGWMRADGAVIPGGNAVTGVTPNLSGGIYLRGSTTYGVTGGSNTKTLSASEMPSHTHNMDHGHSNTFGLGGTTTFATSAHTHNMRHTHQTLATGINLGVKIISGLESASVGYNTTTWTTPSGTGFTVLDQLLTPGGAGSESFAQINTTQPQFFSSRPLDSGGSALDNTGSSSANATVTFSGSVSNMTGSTGSAGSGLSFSIEPNYVSVIYMIRVN